MSAEQVRRLDYGIDDAASKYLHRCRRAGDQRPILKLLEEIVQPDLAADLAARLEWLWVA